MATSSYLDYKKNVASSDKAASGGGNTSAYAEYLKSKKTPISEPGEQGAPEPPPVGVVSVGPRRSLVQSETAANQEQPTSIISQKDPNQEVSKRRGAINTVLDTVSKIGSSNNRFTTYLDRGISMAMNSTNPFMQGLNTIKQRIQDKKGVDTNYAVSSAARLTESTLAMAQDVLIRAPRGAKNFLKKGASKAERINGALDIGLAGAEALFFPAVVGFNAQKAGVEATGKGGKLAGRVVDKGFEALAHMGAWGAGKVLQAVPEGVLSSEAKTHLEKNVEEVGGQLSMILSTVLLHKAVGGFMNKKGPTEFAVGDTMKKMLGIEESGIPTREAIDKAYKETMESFKDKPDFESRASVATTAYRALKDFHDLSPVEFQRKWVETTKALEERVPELQEEIRKNIEQASVENTAAQALNARSAPIGDTEAGYRTIQDLRGSAPDVYMAEAVTNVKRAIEAEAGKVPVRVEDNRASDVPARMDMQTGEITVNPTAILKLVEVRESMGDVRRGESRADLEQRIVREEVSRQQVAFEQMTPSDKIAQKVAQETGVQAEPKITFREDNPIHDRVMGELVGAEAGKRRVTKNAEDAGYTSVAQRSTFPDWIPEDLRRKPLLDAVSRHIMEGTVPTSKPELRLYRVVREEMNAQNEVLNDLKFIERERNNLFDPFATAEENAAALKKFDQEYAKLKSDESKQGGASESGKQVQGMGESVQTEAPTTGKEKPVGDTPSKVGESIQAKAIEQGITEGFEGTALYEKKTVEGQAKLVSELISADTVKAERIVRGEESLPAEVNPGFFIKGMEDYISTIKDINERARLNYELANSSLVSETSAAAQTLRFLQERTPDSAVSAIKRAEALKKEAAKTLGKNSEKVKAEIKESMKKTKTTATKETWESFVQSIQC